MADWQKRVKENEGIILFWYKKITGAGHGNLTITVNKNNGTIEVRPELSIRTVEEQRAYKEL